MCDLYGSILALEQKKANFLPVGRQVPFYGISCFMLDFSEVFKSLKRFVSELSE